MGANWKRKLDVSDIFRGEQPFEVRRDEMVRRVRALDSSDWELQDIADELSEAADVDEWDESWDTFYDWADAGRVWVVTR